MKPPFRRGRLCRNVDRTGRCSPYALGGVLVASVATALLPHISGQATLLTLVAVFGAVSDIAFVAISVALAASSTPAARGLVMGGYSTALYLGLALGSFALEAAGSRPHLERASIPTV